MLLTSAITLRQTLYVKRPAKMEKSPDLLTRAEASEILTELRGVRTSIDLLDQWRYYGRGPEYLTRGRNVFYRAEELESFAENEGKGRNNKSAGNDEPLAGCYKLKPTSRDSVYRLPPGKLVGLWIWGKRRKAEQVEFETVRSAAEFYGGDRRVVVIERGKEILVRTEMKTRNLYAIVKTERTR
jgi:hypothetical protein